jgi:hypothetical protein
MAVIALESILGILGVGDAFARRNDAQFWSGWLDGDGNTRKLKVTSASFDEHGFELTVDDGGETITLAAVPKDIGHTKVLVNGQEDPKASLVFAPKFSFGNRSRWAFDFRPVTLGAKKNLRFNIRYDP